MCPLFTEKLIMALTASRRDERCMQFIASRLNQRGVNQDIKLNLMTEGARNTIRIVAYDISEADYNWLNGYAWALYDLWNRLEGEA